MNFDLKNKKTYLILVGIPIGISVLVVLAILFVPNLLSKNNVNIGSSTSVVTEVVPTPDVTGKIKGYWSSRGGAVLKELTDADKMREVGINTITFSPSLQHDEEGNVSERGGQESYVKQAINKAHKEGFRVMLETTPMNAGAVDTHVKNPKLFTDEMTRVSLKYAAIAEEYGAEFFAPIVEPGHHISIALADSWMQELLPKLKAVYTGPIMWKKQAMHIDDAKEWKTDHIMTMGFQPNNKRVQLNFKETMEGNVSLGIQNNTLNLERRKNGNQIYAETKTVSIPKNQFNTLRIEIVGTQIKVYINDALAMTKTDTVGPEGGYSLSSESMVINKFEITDTVGVSLLTEKFEHLNNWNPRDGWKIENGQIVISSNTRAELIHDIDFSGYDYIAIDTFRRGHAQTSADYLEHLEFIIDKTNDQAKSDGVPHVILAEFGGSIEEDVGWRDNDERAKIPITATELASVTKRVLEIAEVKLDGYMYNGWNIKGQGIDELPEIENVIKEWYNSH